MKTSSKELDGSASGPARALATWLLATCLASCVGGGGLTDVVDDSAYVEVMSQLAALRWRFSVRDSLAADSARFVILQERGLTGEDLERFAARRGSDPQAMAVLWEIIAARADELAGGLHQEVEVDPQTADSTGVRRP